ncbi:MAG: 1,4-alpha-glucan branching protein GlgB [Egibacteraceae bacterium]
MRDLASALSDWLPQQRWFQGKARTVCGVEMADAVRLGERLIDLFIDVEYAFGPGERYQVPVVDGEEITDATTDPDACRLLAGLTLGPQAGVATGGARVVGRSVTGEAPGAGDEPRCMAGEQSNTSVVFGERTILKLFRRLEEGVNPDVEVTRALTAAGFRHVPAQHGALELIEDGVPTALAVLSEFVAGQDGFVAATAEVAEVAPGRLALDDAPVLAVVGGLGAVVAELHVALREIFGEEEASEREAALRVATMRARARELLALAAERAPDVAAALLERREEVMRGFDALAVAPDLGPLVRVHGDLHLGQVLLVGSDAWKLLDFEGEPARPLAQRRARSSPLRDVAGILRSFDYVADAQPDPRALEWRARARERFLDAYLAGADAAGLLLPKSPEPVLAAFEFDKAIYELGYELRLRPDWASIPVAGILRMLDATGSGRSPEMTSQTTPAGDLPPAPLPQWRADPDEVKALVQGAHTDPHRLLGAHPVSGGAVVRAYRPDAERVEVVTAAGTVDAEQTAPGFFEARLDALPRPGEYRLRVRYPGGATFELSDPYAFWPTLGEVDLHLIGEGRHEQLWQRMGAHVLQIEGTTGTAFAVWAPNAQAVRVVGDFNSWDGRLHPMRSLGGSGIWELFVPDVGAGACYKYEVVGADGRLRARADPYAFWTQAPPDTASRVFVSTYSWGDAAWFAQREARALIASPVSIYEVHLGSWRRRDGRPLSYRELAPLLAEHVAALGFTHVELMPPAEHPFSGSWGYQVTGYFAPTARYGDPDDFRFLVDHLHQHGVGVIIDWVPAHFPRDDWALARFDGTALYEHADPRKGEHAEWGTLVFNFGRHEVRNFLIANALYWLSELHIDGLRVDAVASMLYLDYSRDEGEWVPNSYGGRENLEAVAFLKELNALAYGHNPGVTTVAEESTAWPAVSRPTHLGGLGFGFKWNMGWMHDTLLYFSKDPIHRRYHHNDLTFGLLYAWTENFILPLSHDEVVHGKRSLLDKMPGDRWQKFANLRALYGWMWAHPGKQLLFMGGELGQWSEWHEGAELDWHLLEHADHAGLMRLVADLNRTYKTLPALWERDADPSGFAWIDANNADDNVLAFLRHAEHDAPPVACIANLSPVPRPGVRIGLPTPGVWKELLNTDAQIYGGSNVGNCGAVTAEPVPWHGQPASAQLTLPPLATLWLTPHD